jgi:hypothetical protein
MFIRRALVLTAQGGARRGHRRVPTRRRGARHPLVRRVVVGAHDSVSRRARCSLLPVTGGPDLDDLMLLGAWRSSVAWIQEDATTSVH